MEEAKLRSTLNTAFAMIRKAYWTGREMPDDCRRDYLPPPGVKHSEVIRDDPGCKVCDHVTFCRLEAGVKYMKPEGEQKAQSGDPDLEGIYQRGQREGYSTCKEKVDKAISVARTYPDPEAELSMLLFGLKDI